jgi:hypothetical protein
VGAIATRFYRPLSRSRRSLKVATAASL